MNNYTSTTLLNCSESTVFNALTIGIPCWWTEMFEGTGENSGDVFTVRFGESVHKTMQVQELSHNKKIVWHVADSLIDIPQLKNQTEWIGTTIVWEIFKRENSTELRLTHIGLSPDIECYTICAGGWKQFTESIKLFVETGKGNPFKK